MTRPGVQDLLILAIGIVLLFHLGDMADDPGLGWHLRTGQWIAENHSVPREDPFLFSFEKRPWISDQWLSDVVLYLLYEAGGWHPLYLLVLAAFLVSFLVALYRRVAEDCGSALAASVAVLLAIRAAQIHLIVRPVALSIALFAILFASLPGQARRSDTLLYVAMFLLWANMHPAFVLGLLAMWLWVLEGALMGREIGSRFVPAAAATIATALNPYGIDLHESILTLGRSDYFMSLNAEWRPPDPLALETIVTFALLTGAAASCALRRQTRLFHLLCLLVLAPLAARSVRIIPYAVVAAALPFADLLAGIGERVAGASPFRLTASKLRKLEGIERGSWRGAFGIAVWAVIAAVCLHRNEPSLGPSRSEFPYASLDRLLAEGGDAVVAATPDWGGFITWRGAPAVRAVIDDRNTLLGEDAYRRYLTALRPGGPWMPYLEEVGASHLLLRRDDPLVPEISKSGRFVEIHRDDRSVLFVVGREARPAPG